MFESYTIITEVLGEPRYFTVDAVEDSFNSCKSAVAEIEAMNNKRYNCSCEITVAIRVGNMLYKRVPAERILESNSVNDIMNYYG